MVQYFEWSFYALNQEPVLITIPMEAFGTFLLFRVFGSGPEINQLLFGARPDGLDPTRLSLWVTSTRAGVVDEAQGSIWWWFCVR